LFKHYILALWRVIIFYYTLRAQYLARPYTMGRVGVFSIFGDDDVELTGAEILVRCLKDEGVEYVFGYPGGAVLHIYDALYRQEDVKHILVRHEQGATHAADGYARSTGRPGVVLVTSGPGATNAITGIATAHMDSIPMVVITGQVPTTAIGSDAFQEVDSVGITRPCVKHNFLVKDVKDLATTIKKAFYLATTGRPGSVVVDVPKDVTAERAEYHYPKEVSIFNAHRQKAHALYGWRRDIERRAGCTHRNDAYVRFPHHTNVDGAGCLPCHRSAITRHARHARHL
ncbi:MAG: acetolactate synthase I/II/III large subunit, partial [Halothiobacillaceae bacterium]